MLFLLLIHHYFVVMAFFKKYLPISTLLALTLCLFSFSAYAEYNPSKAVDDTLGIMKQGGLNFIYNNYLLSVFIVLLVTFGFDYDYYVQNKLKVEFSRFTTIFAIIGVCACTIIKLFY